MAGAATQIFSHEFDTVLSRVPNKAKSLILQKITEMGLRLAAYPHYRMTGRPEFRLRVGDYRVLYDFDPTRNEIVLSTLGHRREVYR